ncbi:MAG: hypothetical protein PHY47_27665 [Lachnospiraceae bacterium]|nr:hypothetical protein [Lachnospiraceae bacterium]
MNYTFKETYDALNPNQKCLISNTMVCMEHTTPEKFIDMKYGIRYGIIINDMTQNELLNLALPKYKEIKKITYDDFNIENTYKAMLQYNSKKSPLYNIVLDILDIDENIIKNCYFSQLLSSPEKLFESLTPRDQDALIYLINNINSDYSIKEIGDIGVEEQFKNIPFKEFTI